jgi:hypothetical protein
MSVAAEDQPVTTRDTVTDNTGRVPVERGVRPQQHRSRRLGATQTPHRGQGVADHPGSSAWQPQVLVGQCRQVALLGQYATIGTRPAQDTRLGSSKFADATGRV